jgi:hydrogenase expression/formation protein HypC
MRVVKVDSEFKATVEAEGISRMVDVSLLEGVSVGDYLIVHAGFAIEKLDPREADARIELFAEMARLDAEGAGGGA